MGSLTSRDANHDAENVSGNSKKIMHRLDSALDELF